jgi:anti-sigma factor RsiW
MARLPFPPARALPCEEVRALITDYLEGALPRGLRRSIERHLAACPECGPHLAQMRASIALTGRLADGELPRELSAALEQALAEWDPAAVEAER